jgi:chromosome partitioning protein
MAKRFAVSNRKGGTGKTTTAVNLAASLAEEGYRVLLIDLDAQTNATIWVGVEPEEPGTIELLTQKESVSSLARSSPVEGLDVIPATKRMTSAEQVLQKVAAGEKHRLKEALGGNPSWDYVFMDCPANFGLITMNAMVAATDLIVPVEASDMAVDGAVDLLSVFTDVRQYYNSELKMAGLLVCRVDHRTNHSRDVISTLQEKLGDHVFSTTITQNVAVQDSYRHETPTVLDAPRATASEEYRKLAREIA